MTLPDPKPPRKAKIKKPGRRRRRIFFLLIAVVALILMFRAVLSILLPSVLNKIAGGYGLKCTYDRLELTLTGGSADLWNFQVLPLEGGDPIVHADYLQGDISLTGLLKGRLIVYRAAADGVDLTVQRNADGHIPLLDRFASHTSSPAPAKSSAATSAPPTPSLQPPLRLDELRLQHIRARFRDLFVQPQVDTRLALDFRLSNLGTPGEPAYVELDFSSEPILDTLQIEARSTGDDKNLSATLTILMRGLHLKPAQGYLLALGLRPTADDISAAMTGNLTANIAPNPADGIQANLSLDGAHITSDNAEAAAIDHLSLDIDSLSAGSIKLGKLAIDGLRCNAARNPSGSLAVAGVEFIPVPPQPPVAPSPAPTTATPSAPFHWSLDQFLLTTLHVGFDDQSISPPVVLALDSPRIELDHLNSNPSPPDSPSDFSISLNSPGLVRKINIAGQISPFSPIISFKFAAEAKGINPIAAEPYLNAAGLSSEWKDGTLSVSADGSASLDPTGKLTASARLANFRLADTHELLSLKNAQIKGVTIDPQSRSILADSIEVTGPGLRIHRDSDGNLHFLAFKTRPPTAAPAPAVATDPPPAAHPSSPAFDHFEISHFAWKGVNVTLADDAISPPATLAIPDAGFTFDDFSVDLHPTDKPPKQGHFQAWLVAPQIASRLALDGVLTPSFEQTNCDFQISGEGIHGDALVPYLKPMGIQPTLKDGSLHLHGNVRLDTSADQPKLSLSCDNLKYNDGPDPLVSVAQIGISGISPTKNGISFDSITVQSPHAQVVRQPNGLVEAAGLRFVAAPPAPAASQSDPPATLPTPTTQPTFATAVKTLKISDVGIDWNDQSVHPAVQTSLNLGADLSNFVLGPESNSAPFHVTLAVAGSLDQLVADGTVSVTPSSQSLRVNVDATGLRAGPAAVYLPPNLRMTLKAGQFHSAIAADIAKNPQGGQAIDLKISDVDYRDSGSAESFLKLNSLHLKVPRHDMAARVAAIDDLTLDGFETTIRKTYAGTELLGLQLTAAQPDPPADPPSDPPASPTVSPSVSPPAISPTTQPSDNNVLRQIAAQRNKYPTFSLQNLDLVASKISIIDETNPTAKPLVVSNLRIHNPQPITLLGNDPESNPPTEIDVTGKIDPLADNLLLVAKTTPFARQKSLSLDLTLSDIHGDGLTAIDPALAPKIDGSQLQHGQLRASLLANLKLQNVLATDFDLSRGGKLDFSLTNLAFRADPKGPVLAGIGEIHSEGIILGPNLGGVDVPELEIDNITGRAQKKADGLHVVGLVLKSAPHQPATDAPSPTPSRREIESEPETPAPSGEYKVDRLIVSGMDFRVEDQTSDPPTLIPINGLDIEAQGLSSLATVQDKPIRFDLLASADKVPLPAAESGKTVPRELFSQIAGSGVVSLYPNLKGWTKLSINGFELTGIRGLAAQEKIKLGAGTFDTNIDLRFPGDGSVDTSTRLVFTDLSLSEPPDGIIRRTLNLPAPLDLVILALQDQDGSITIPLNIAIQEGQVNGAAIVGAGVGALAEIIATAIASSPLKLTNLFGLNAKPDTLPPVRLTFPPGYSALNTDQIALLQSLADRLRKDKTLQATLRCDPGRGDIELARQRVNPGPDDARTLAAALARRREILLAARLEAASQVRALLASTDTSDAAGGIERLRTIDRQLNDTENAMDYAYDLLRPGADRQTTRRTRAATQAIAQARLESVRDFLLGPNKRPIAPDRIHLANSQFTESPETDVGTVTITIVKTK